MIILTDEIYLRNLREIKIIHSLLTLFFNCVFSLCKFHIQDFEENNINKENFIKNIYRD